MLQETIRIRLLHGDALKIDVDVLALKYAQANYGLDAIVSQILTAEKIDPSLMKPLPNEFQLINGVSGITARKILFVGVESILYFEYPGIRNFSRRVLSALARSASEVRRIALTLHGAGYGLDENEAFESEVAGLLDGICNLNFPRNLTEIVIVEGNKGRAQRLDKILKKLIPTGSIDINFPNSCTGGGGKIPVIANEYSEILSTAGYDLKSKDHIFVAMPFKVEMDDIYHYGIQSVVQDFGFLCERADLSSFTGDIMDWVLKRIKTASFVIADLTEANPNVYLEVGYAWGCGVPTILLAKDSINPLKFDTQGQRCLSYKNIRNLEESLKKELKALLRNMTN